jgi:hypothetical protein
LVVAALALFVVTFWAALGQPPLTGTTIEWVLGFVLVTLVNLGLGTATTAIWDHHEPCGSSGQYTNSVKPYLNFPVPINGSSFHPNAAGQQTLADLVACYLGANHAPPDPFVSAGSHTITIPASQLVTPAQLGLVPSPGLNSVPGSGVISGC